MFQISWNSTLFLCEHSFVYTCIQDIQTDVFSKKNDYSSLKSTLKNLHICGLITSSLPTEGAKAFILPTMDGI